MESKNLEYGWVNYSNHDFYSTLPSKDFEDSISKSGLDACADMVLIQSHIDHAHHILEVGAGLGRATRYLCNNSQGAVVEAVEYSQKLYNHLISLNLSATIHHADILNFTPTEKFDLIILPWACFTEFNPKEQLQLMQHLYNISTPKATICIDLILPQAVPTNACASSGQFHSLKCGEFALTLDTYLPTDTEMSDMAAACKFVNYHNITYITATKRLRKMHIMQKR